MGQRWRMGDSLGVWLGRAEDKQGKRTTLEAGRLNNWCAHDIRMLRVPRRNQLVSLAIPCGYQRASHARERRECVAQRKHFPPKRAAADCVSCRPRRMHGAHVGSTVIGGCSPVLRGGGAHGASGALGTPRWSDIRKVTPTKGFAAAASR